MELSWLGNKRLKIRQHKYIENAIYFCNKFQTLRLKIFYKPIKVGLLPYSVLSEQREGKHDDG